MEAALCLMAAILFTLVSTPALASDQSLTHTIYVKVKSSASTATGVGKSKAMTYRRRKAVEAGMKSAVRNLLKPC